MNASIKVHITTDYPFILDKTGEEFYPIEGDYVFHLTDPSLQSDNYRWVTAKMNLGTSDDQFYHLSTQDLKKYADPKDWEMIDNYVADAMNVNSGTDSWLNNARLRLMQHLGLADNTKLGKFLDKLGLGAETFLKYILILLALFVLFFVLTKVYEISKKR